MADGSAALGTPVGDVAGTVHVERDLATNEVRGSVSDVDLFLGDRKDAGDDTDDVGVSISNGDAAFLIKPNGTYAFHASGDFALENVGDVTFGGDDFSAEVNTTGEDVEVTDDVTLAAGVNRFAGDNVTFAVGDFSTDGQLRGGAVDAPGRGRASRHRGRRDGDPRRRVRPRSRHRLADGVKVAVTGAGFVLLVDNDNNYALDASGTAAVTGVSGLTLSGTVSLQINTSAAAITRQLVDRGRHAHARRARGPVLPPLRRRERPPRRPRQRDRRPFSVEQSGDNVSVDIDDASVSLAGGLVSAHADDSTISITPDGLTASGLHVRRGHVARPRLLRLGGGQRRLLRRRRQRERLLQGLGRRQRRTTRRSASSATT